MHFFFPSNARRPQLFPPDRHIPQFCENVDLEKLNWRHAKIKVMKNIVDIQLVFPFIMHYWTLPVIQGGEHARKP